tara:strand:+ start:241 stop:549 length:309 start_codon:yes stop_codon:yes gene_type:complete
MDKRKDRDKEIIGWLLNRGEDLAYSEGYKAHYLYGSSKKPIPANIRGVLMYRLKEDYEYTYERIGEIFNRDHSTVKYWVRRINELLSIGDRSTIRYMDYTKP